MGAVQDADVVDAIIQHIDFTLLELTKCTIKSNIEEARLVLDLLNDGYYRKRSHVLHERLLCNSAVHNNNLILEFINSYNYTIMTVKMMLECFLFSKYE
jgi:hypothetical protein